MDQESCTDITRVFVIVALIVASAATFVGAAGPLVHRLTIGRSRETNPVNAAIGALSRIPFGHVVTSRGKMEHHPCLTVMTGACTAVVGHVPPVKTPAS